MKEEKNILHMIKGDVRLILWWAILVMAFMLAIIFNLVELHRQSNRTIDELTSKIDRLEKIIEMRFKESMLLHLDKERFIKEYDIKSYRDEWNKDKWLNK